MNFPRFPKNKLLLFVAFLATVAVVSYGSTKLTINRLDYGQQASSSLNQNRTATVISQLPVPATGTSAVELSDVYQNQNKLITVLRVIDGDTIVVNISGLPVHVRLIGINSPEPNDKRTRVACLAQRAKEEAEKLLGGQKVELEKDPTQGDYDKYNRLLAYVFLPSGVNFNKLMIEEGYAYEYTYRLPAQAGMPYKYQSEFKAAQNKARTDQKGLWNPDICII